MRTVTYKAILMATFALAIGLTACSGGEDPAPETPPAPEEPAAPAVDARVLKAAGVSKAVAKDPAAAEKALADAGMSADAFDDLMYEIAEDEALSAQYKAALAD